LYIEYIDNIE